MGRIDKYRHNRMMLLLLRILGGTGWGIFPSFPCHISGGRCYLHVQCSHWPADHLLTFRSRVSDFLETAFWKLVNGLPSDLMYFPADIENHRASIPRSLVCWKISLNKCCRLNLTGAGQGYDNFFTALIPWSRIKFWELDFGNLFDWIDTRWKESHTLLMNSLLLRILMINSKCYKYKYLIMKIFIFDF